MCRARQPDPGPNLQGRLPRWEHDSRLPPWHTDNAGPTGARSSRARSHRASLPFLGSADLWAPAVVHFRRGLSQMRAGQPFGLLFFFLFFVFCCEMQRKAANHLSLSISELEGCRSLAIVVLRNVEEYSCTERRVIAGIGRASCFGLGKTVIVSQPGVLRSE